MYQERKSSKEKNPGKESRNSDMSTRIYIGRLSYDVRERDIEKFFEGYGRIREILIKNGFGFVEFDDYRDADDAVYALNGRQLLGERVTIEHARGSPRGNDMYRDRNRGYRAPMRRGRQGGGGGGGGGRDKYGPPTRTEYRLVVENLSSRVSWQDLKDYMRQAGEVTYADAHKQRRNEGVVEFASFSDMKNAIDKLDDTDLSGRRIKLVEDKSRRRRSSRSRSRSRSKSSRSHSRSRSRSRSKSRSMSKSRSRSKSRSKSRSRSKSPVKERSNRSHSRKQSHSRSRSRSMSVDRNDRKSRSRSKSQKSRSRSRSHSQSRSRSRSKSSEKRMESPVQKEDDVSNSADDKI